MLRAQGRGGSIVFVASKNALVAGKNAAAYSSAKAAELHLARCLAEEGGDRGIRVNTVNPDAVLQGSRIWGSSWREERAAAYGIEPDELEEHYRRRTTLGVNILPEDIAEAVLHFASDAPLGQEHRQRAQRRRRRSGGVPPVGCESRSSSPASTTRCSRHTGAAVVTLLERLGHEVDVPGGADLLRADARQHRLRGATGSRWRDRFERVFAGDEAVVSPSASCVGDGARPLPGGGRAACSS